MTMELTRGANAPVTGDVIVATIGCDQMPTGLDVDLSAYLLTADGRVRGDADMLFYGNAADADESVRFDKAGGRFTVRTDAVPAAIDRIALCVVVDGGAAAALGAITLSIADGPSYRHATDGQPEAAIIVGELYRRAGAWKLRAIGQGFAGGLAPLARSYGIEVAEGAPAPPPRVDLRKQALARKLVDLGKTDARLVDLTKTAAVSLAKTGADTRAAKFWLVLDVSGSMRGLFRSGAVDRLIQRCMAYALNLDDDGDISCVLFDNAARMIAPITAATYAGTAAEVMARRDIWGSTDYGRAMRLVRETAAVDADFGTVPVYVMVVTDGGTENRPLAERQIQEAAAEGIFWKFMAIGPMPKGVAPKGRALPRGFDFLAYLDDMPGRVVDNADFFAVTDPDDPSDEAFFDLMANEYAAWIAAATKAGVLRG
ncbi:hypothetical protein ASE75_04060 [Sphingomonas sp. Leaf17]|uniref:VWA domain-containing protein n=1 Tax=Sphingomonas sp. Leaf17 TaxID=1735683 RepID=UPI0006FA18D1|nr:VWA domain-containing protein [Sphingomonas sp. Leaf17]KQM68037.1 hypothetical protein ASE75_04060 [Sphingomonas sp. Leaf17]